MKKARWCRGSKPRYTKLEVGNSYASFIRSVLATYVRSEWHNLVLTYLPALVKLWPSPRTNRVCDSSGLTCAVRGMR